MPEAATPPHNQAPISHAEAPSHGPAVTELASIRGHGLAETAASADRGAFTELPFVTGPEAPSQLPRMGAGKHPSWSGTHG